MKLFTYNSIRIVGICTFAYMVIVGCTAPETKLASLVGIPFLLGTAYSLIGIWKEARWKN